MTLGQAHAITNAVLQAAEQGDHMTVDRFNAGIAEPRIETAGQRADTAGRISEIAGYVAERRAEIAELRAQQRTTTPNRNSASNRHNTPSVPWDASALPARTTVAHRYCSDSRSMVTDAGNGR